MQQANISDILATIRTYSPDANVQPVMTAYLLAARAHAGQTRKSGEPYLTHPLAVAKILADIRMDVDTIATALLHDALEDNPLSKEELRDEMGPVIAELVDGVTKIGKLRFKSKEELQAENFRKIMLAMSKDIRVILVKIADRTHNMLTLGGHGDPAKQKLIADETMEIYVPIASRLGLDRFKTTLEDLCFRYMYPEAFESITAYLEDTQADRERYIRTVVDHLDQLLAPHDVPCEVTGRAKHPYSVFRKMKEQHLAVDKIKDLLAFRVIVDDVGQCYAILGVLHAEYPPIPGRIKDYIARPKPNGYQSLHTTVLGPDSRLIEIQIRTREMHRVAEEGIAAHWRYKEGHLALTPDDVARISKIRDLFETAREAEDATEFMETVKVEFYANEVFIFTPAGDIKRFPAGATALDFAYAVHTEVGNTCTGARVNGRLVPLRYELESGDSVEIVTSKNQKPNRDWLDIAKTGRAIQKIRRFLREEERELGVRIGREMLDGELRRLGSSLKRVHSDGRLNNLLEERNYDDVESLLVDVARGQTGLSSTAKGLIPPKAVEETAPGTVGQISSLFTRWRTRSESPVLISGEDGVLVSFARCCSPLPGESVLGYITRGRGITVHRMDCHQLKKLNADRRIPVQWDPASDQRHTGELQIVCTDRPGLLANISKVCELANVNISRAEARNIGDDRAVCTLELAVRDVSELQRLTRHIEKISGVESVHRTEG